MPPTPPDPSPTRQVERIREILVGRQMHGIEQRLDRLEARLQPMPVADPAAYDSLRREHREALLKLRDDFDAEKLRQQEETRRLAAQIQNVARQRREIADEARQAVIDHLKPGFESWQSGMMSWLGQREKELEKRLEERLEALRPLSSSLPAPSPALAEALRDFAKAARELGNAFQPPATS